MPQSKNTIRDRETGGSRAVLAAAYAATFGHLGVVMPFLAPWLRERGFEAAAIGVLLALPPLAKIVTPWTWAPLADRRNCRVALMGGCAAFAAVAMASMAAARPLPVLALLVGLYGFSRAPVLPFLEATALEQSERRGLAYGPIRLWGSVAFVVAAGGYGVVRPALHGDAVLYVGAALLAATAVATRWMPAPWSQAGPASPRGSRLTAESGAALVRFFAACALMQASHGAYYVFYSIHLQDAGYGPAAIGSLWAFAVICEVALLACFDRVVDRLGSRIVLHGALLVAAGRWLLLGSTVEPGWLVAGQALHAVTYGAFHVTAVRVVHRSFPSGSRARGQAYYSGMTFGVGMFAGSLAAGALAEPLGLEGLFRVSAMVALAGLPVLGLRRLGTARS